MRFVLGFVAALALAVLLGLAFVWSGAYNIAASDPHYDAVRWVFETTMKNSVERRAEDVEAPARFTDAQIREGFVEFDAMCVHCHGAPGEEAADWARGMRPEPPALAEKATHWNSAQVFWIVKHGIKMSAMPAFGATHDDETLWKIVAFVERLPSLSPEAYAQLREEVGEGAVAGHGGHAHGTN